jgi:hypothetical protein
MGSVRVKKRSCDRRCAAESSWARWHRSTLDKCNRRLSPAGCYMPRGKRAQEAEAPMRRPRGRRGAGRGARAPTRRQRPEQIERLARRGLDSEGIASRLGLSRSTVNQDPHPRRPPAGQWARRGAPQDGPQGVLAASLRAPPLPALHRPAARIRHYLTWYNFDRVHDGRLTRGPIHADMFCGARKMEAR